MDSTKLTLRLVQFELCRVVSLYFELWTGISGWGYVPPLIQGMILKAYPTSAPTDCLRQVYEVSYEDMISAVPGWLETHAPAICEDPSQIQFLLGDGASTRKPPLQEKRTYGDWGLLFASVWALIRYLNISLLRWYKWILIIKSSDRDRSLSVSMGIILYPVRKHKIYQISSAWTSGDHMEIDNAFRALFDSSENKTNLTARSR
jgi:hypothetical protein